MTVITTDPKAGELCKKYDTLKTYKANWEGHWKEVSYYVVPKKDAIYGTTTDGDKKENKLFDASGVHANEMLAAALHGMLTNPSSIWFDMSFGDPKIDARDDVRAWRQHAVDRMIYVLNNSNFQTEVHEVYVDLGGFGTACLRMEEDEETHIRFHARPIYEVSIAENHKEMIDTVYYEYERTLKQIVDEFGKEALDADMMRDFETNMLKKERILHAVEPRSSDTTKAPVPTNLPFASYHILMRNKKIVKESGFHENPYAIPRWTKLSGEMYGRGPGMKALADIKMLNKMKQVTIEAAQLAAFPPLQMPDDGVLLPLIFKPKGINTYRSGSKDRIEPIVTGSNIGLSEQLMENVRRQIKEAFYIDQLITPENDRMTATEIMQRREEQLRTLGPILGRMHYEFLKPLVERLFGILSRKGVIQPPPQDLMKSEYIVRYTSLVAKAQRTMEAGNFSRAMQLIAPMVQAQPESLDYLDGDATVKYAADIFGVSASIIRDDAKVEEIRKARQQAQAQQSQMQAQMQQAEIANKLAPAIQEE